MFPDSQGARLGFGRHGWLGIKLLVVDNNTARHAVTKDQVIRENPAGAVVVRAWPGHRNIGRGACRSALPWRSRPGRWSRTPVNTYLLTYHARNLRGRRPG